MVKIGRNGAAIRYDISTLLFEMRRMSDHYYEPYALEQKSNGYLIKQTIATLDATVRAISDGQLKQRTQASGILCRNNITYLGKNKQMNK